MPDGLESIFLNSVPRRTRIQRRGRSDKKSETGFSGKVSSRLRCASAGEFQNTLPKGGRHSERNARTEGNFYKSFPHERLVYEAVRRTTSSTTTLVEGTGVLRTGVLENRRSGKTGVPEAAVLGNGVSRKRARRNGRKTQNSWKIYPFICAGDSGSSHDDYCIWSYPQMNSRR